MDEFLTDSGNNNTGWSMHRIRPALPRGCQHGRHGRRYAAYQKAEAILLDEMPIIPLYVYSNPRLLQPSVKGWYPNLLDSPNYRSIYLAPQTD